MRLIDADKLRIKCHTVNDLQPDKFVVSRMMVSSEAIDTEPTVEAIPVEWIKERLKKALAFTHSKAEGKIVYDGCVITMVSASFTAQVLWNLLEDWEKENG